MKEDEKPHCDKRWGTLTKEMIVVYLQIEFVQSPIDFEAE